MDQSNAEILETVYPVEPARIPPGVLVSGRYSIRYAASLADLQAVQRLRYEVFNLELGEGLAGAHVTGLDADAHDLRCHHLMVTEVEGGRVIGTYRMTSAELLGDRAWYSDAEFELRAMPAGVLAQSVEVGRACVDAEHRNGRVLQLLWKGIARYLEHNAKRYLFGCCSVPSLDPDEIARVSLQLLRGAANHESIHVAARTRAHFESARPVQLHEAEAELPALFASYLRLGARVCGGPAADPEFGVTDYLVLLDLEDVPAAVMARLGRASHWRMAA